MASYEAQINILVAGQRNINNLANQLNAIENSIDQIERRWRTASAALQRSQIRLNVTGAEQPRGEGGRFIRDPDRQARFTAFADRRRATVQQRLARLSLSRAAAEAAVTRGQIEDNQTSLRQTERRIALESRLNSAVTIFQRQQRAYARGGGGARLTEDLQQRAIAAQAAFEAAGGPLARNLQLVSSLAREMTTIAESQREINRGSTIQSKGFYKSQEFERRIADLRRAGVPAQSFQTVGRQIGEYRSAIARTNQPEAEDVARRIDQNLKRISRELDEAFASFRKTDSARRAARSWQTFFEDAASQALRIRQNAIEARTSWASFFESAANQALQVKQNAVETKNSWKMFFEDATNQALQVQQNAKETKQSWKAFFEDAANQALEIKQNSISTKNNWKSFFNDAAEQALQIKQNAVDTKNSWRSFFEDAANQALQIKQIAAKTKGSWQEFFNNAANQALQIKQEAKKTKQSWKSFFDDAASEAFAIKQNAKRTRLAWQQFFADAEQQARMYRSRPVASMTPQERVSTGVLDPGSLRAQRLRRVEIGRLDPLERFYAGFQPRGRAARSARATSEGLIGGAFPLLFGQGTGAAVGGGLGGFAGGFAGGGLGFGLSLIGTAAGTAIDTFMTNLKGLADSLNDPTAALEAMKTAGLTVSKEIDRTVKSLESSGNAYGAQLIVLKELERQLGTGSVKQLQALSVAQKKLDELTSSLSATIISSLLPAIIGFIATINDLSGPLTALSGSKRPEWLKELPLLLGAYGAGSAPGMGFFTGAVMSGLLERGKRETAAQSGRPEVREKTMREAQLQAYQKQLETMDLGKSVTDQARQAAREQRDLDKQNADLVRSYEESLGQLRQSIEDEVARRRFMILEKENELLDLQGENRLKQLEIFNTKAISEAGAGQLPEVEAVAKEVATIVADFTRNQLSAEEEAAKIKRKAALDARQLDFEAAKFKIGIEKELSRLNIETARQVASINEQVVRRNEDANENRLLIEKAIAVVQLQLASSNAQKDKQIAEEYLKSVPKGTREEEFAANIFKTRSEILAQTNEALQRVQAVQPPGKLKRLPGVRLGGVSTTELDSLLSDQKQAINAAVEESLKGFDLTKALNIEEFKSKVNNLANTIEKPLADIGRAMGKEQARNIRYMQLVRSGASEAAASKIIEVEQQMELTDLTYKAAIAEIEKRRNIEGTSEAQKSILNTVIAELKARRETIPGVAIGLTTSIMEKEGERGRIQTQADAAEEQLNRLISMSYQVTEAAKAIGSAFSDSFKGVVNGTMTAQEALGSFFQNIADYFLDMATQIISKWIEMTILNSVLKLFPGGNLFSPSAGGGDFASAWSGASGQGAMGYLNAGPQIFANGGAFAQNGIVPFAMGGIVNSPTLFKFADGGAMRNGLMGEAGPEAIMPLKRGPGGRLGVEASGGGGSVAVTVHVDASGSKVAGEDTQANQLGRVIAAAVQSELVKQKRPGGLLS